MAKRLSLRRWQQEALHRFETTGQRDFLAVATPGAGKTTFALTACVRALMARGAGRVVIVAPTQHLKYQWAEAAEPFGLSLEPDWASSDGALPSDIHGVIVTFQQVAANPRALRPLAKRAFAILDEIHHAADSRAWGDGIRLALHDASHRLCISGTPFRSDQNSIPFVRYRGDRAEPDYEYGYGEALSDRRVVRPVFFPRIGGQMEWNAPDGSSRSHGFDDRIGRTLASQRLRTALDLGNEWLPSVLKQAHAQLQHLREFDPRAGAMVIAMDQDHARGIARLLREELGVRAAIATSDDPEASARIAEFSASAAPWIVAVRMVSEGVDIPRLRVGVYATNTTTDLFFRQAVGRLVRWSPGTKGQKAYMFIPDDIRLRSFAEGIRVQRRHDLSRNDSEREVPDANAEEDREVRDEEDQLSLFSVISATPLDENGEPLETRSLFDELSDELDVVGDDGPDEGIELPVIDPSFSLEPVVSQLPADELSVVDLPESEAKPAEPGPSRRQQKKQLRALNLGRAKQLARIARLSHAEVNAELNRRTGIRRITEASLPQLERRVQVAEAWLKRLHRPARSP